VAGAGLGGGAGAAEAVLRASRRGEGGVDAVLERLCDALSEA
jgi:hypothetical protein